MSDDEQQKAKKPQSHWDHINDTLNYGLGMGSRDALDALRMAIQTGIIGKGPPMESFVPGEPFPISSKEPPSPKDAADQKIAELERRLQVEGMERARLETKLAMAKSKVRRLEQDNQSLALEKLQGFGRPSVPDFIKVYLKFMIFACHPDRNPGRNEAVEVTKALLDLRPGNTMRLKP
jgi:hypothetical protein